MVLLTEWFLRDDNAVPPIYVLQPITAKFPYYNDESEENEEKHENRCMYSVDQMYNNEIQYTGYAYANKILHACIYSANHLFQARKDWNNINNLLSATFRAAATCAHKYGHLTAVEMHKYFTSGT